MALSTPCSVWAKIKNWHSKLWNLLETLAIIIFIIGFFLRSTALFKYSPLDEYPRESPITNKTIFEPELTAKEITLIGYGRAFYSGWFSHWSPCSDWLSDWTNHDLVENFSKLILPFGLLEFLNFVPSTKHLDHTWPWPGKWWWICSVLFFFYL